MEERDDFPGGESTEAALVGIDRRFVVHLKGRDYPVYAGVLDAVTRAGLKSLTTAIVQIPTPENGNMAVVMARLELADGRIFEDVGDCSPQTTTPALAAAALRLASTRAKGRVCRDAANCGATLLEELPGADQSPAPSSDRSGYRQAAPAQQPARAAAPQNGGGATCSAPGCGKPISKNEAVRSQHHYKRDLCKDCFPKFEAAAAAP